jgi:hypothetical protein
MIEAFQLLEESKEVNAYDAFHVFSRFRAEEPSNQNGCNWQ